MKEKVTLLTARQNKLQEDFDELRRNISTLETMKKRQRELPEDKEEYLAELLDRRVDMEEKLNRLKDQAKQAEERLSQLEQNGKVSVSAKCYPGTVLLIRDIRTVIRSEYKCVTFTAANGLVQIGKFEDEKTADQKQRK